MPDLSQAIAVLQSGGVLLHPTDTVSGLACDATNPVAIQKIYKIKERNPQKPLLMLCDSMEMVASFVENVPSHVHALMEAFRHLPLTLIYPKARNLPPNLLHISGSIAIRIPNHTPTLGLIKGINAPIASTSANLSGKPTPDSIENIDEHVLNLVDYTLILPAIEKGGKPIPSWILRIEANGFSVIREGQEDEDFSTWLKHLS